MKYYGLPLHILRDVYMTLRSFLMKLKVKDKILFKDLQRYLTSTRNMDTLFPNVSDQELREMNDTYFAIFTVNFKNINFQDLHHLSRSDDYK